MDAYQTEARVRSTISNGNITMVSQSEILEMSMENSYNVIVLDADANKIIEEDYGFFAHNPSKPLIKEEIDAMIHYFTQTEQYERCAKLKEISDTLI